MVDPLQQWWYYTCEYQPGNFTPGRSFPSIAIVRQLLELVDVVGLRVLDLCSMESVAGILCARRGASVMAADRKNWSDKIEFLNRAYATDVAFERFDSLEVYRRAYAWLRPVDVLIWAGALYHVLDPLTALLHARRHVRHGGCAVIETACRIDTDDPTLTLNVDGWGYPDVTAGNFWHPTPRALDVMLRLARLEPLAIRWFRQGDVKAGARIAVLCRAVAEIPSTDQWITAQQYLTEGGISIADVITFESLGSGPAVLPWPDNEPTTVEREMQRTKETPFDVLSKLTDLHLDDRA